MSGLGVPVPTGGRRCPVRVRVAAVGVVAVLAACSGASTTSTARPKKPKTVVSSTTTSTTPPISYQVKRGDTLTSLARFFGVSLTVLTYVNHLGPQAQLTVGQVLQIPQRPPVQLMVTPPDAPAGQAFTLALMGAQPGETVTFEIDAPGGGGKFTGPPHTAAADGSLTTMYQTGQGDNTGTYAVVATGNHGTSARATFRVDPSTPGT